MKPIQTDRAPAAVGPYSQAIRAGKLLFLSGQIPLHPDTGEIVKGGIREQVRRCLENLSAVLAAASAGLESVAKVTIYLTDLGDFAEVNKVYGEYFSTHRPARACVEVSRLPKDAAIEMEAVAVL